MTTVYIALFYVDIRKLEHVLMTADLLNQNTAKKVMLLKKIVLIRCSKWIFSRVLNTIITNKIATGGGGGGGGYFGLWPYGDVPTF